LEKFNYLEHYKIDAKEFDYFEKRNGATEHDERRVHEYIISYVPYKAKSILDVGCGSAWVAKNYLKKQVKVYSLDISLVNPIKALKEYPAGNHFGITADSYKLPFLENSFDCIIASEIIEHIIYPDRFIKELMRVLKPKGEVIITTPYKEVLRYSLCIHCNQKTPINAHINSFDENILINLYKENDLEYVKWQTFGNKLLIFLRTYVILKFLPFSLWKIKDKFANLIYKNPIHIIVTYGKK
jgi:ubiquinone/menaquinone biosynthesis C-methylase UbiE